MRRVRRSGGEIEQDRLLRRDRLVVAQPFDGLVGHVGHEVVALLGRLARLDRRRVLEQHRVILMRLAADEAVEVVEPHAGRPAVVRAGDAALPVGRVVVLAEPAGPVAIVLEHRADGRGAARDHVVVARKAGRPFGEKARAHIMVVAPGDQRGAGGAADGGRMKAVIAKAARRELVELRRRHRPAEGADLAEADIVQQDDDNVRRARRGRGHGRPCRGRVLVGCADLPGECRIGQRELGPVPGWQLGRWFPLFWRLHRPLPR